MYALILERLEGDARALVAAGATGEDDRPYAAQSERERLDKVLTASAADRRAGISDEDWELRVALGVTGGR